MLAQFPFGIADSHTDGGSDDTDSSAAAVPAQAHTDFMRSRPRRSNDNASAPRDRMGKKEVKSGERRSDDPHRARPLERVPRLDQRRARRARVARDLQQRAELRRLL